MKISRPLLIVVSVIAAIGVIACDGGDSIPMKKKGMVHLRVRKIPDSCLKGEGISCLQVYPVLWEKLSSKELSKSFIKFEIIPDMDALGNIRWKTGVEPYMDTGSSQDDDVRMKIREEAIIEANYEFSNTQWEQVKGGRFPAAGFEIHVAAMGGV